MGLVLAAAGLVAACSTTTSGVATAPDDLIPYPGETPSTTTRAPASPSAPRGTAGLPPEAYAEVRAAGIKGSDDAIASQLMMACIMGQSNFNHSKQDVADVLTQLGSRLPSDALLVIVDVAIKYECPDLGGKLGG